jgi:hypothetical protein
MPDERYLSAKDIQARLGVSRCRAYQVIEQMPRIKFGANVRVSETAFAEWLNAHEVTPPPPPPAEARRMRIEARKRAFTSSLDEMPIRRMAPRS